MADKITKRSEDYSQWYLDIVERVVSEVDRRLS